MMQNAILKDALRNSSRREYLCKNFMPCPQCKTAQVQLVDSFVSPAWWRCRHCGLSFEFEPKTTKATLTVSRL